MFILFQIFCTYIPETTTLEVKVYIAGDNPKDELMRSGILREEEIVLEKCRSVKLPDVFQEFTQKDKLRFLLHKVRIYILFVSYYSKVKMVRRKATLRARTAIFSIIFVVADKLIGQMSNTIMNTADTIYNVTVIILLIN